MPKATKVIAGPNGSKRTAKVRCKFKLGGRKQSKSALILSTTELVSLYASPQRKRDLPKIVAVLLMRGIVV